MQASPTSVPDRLRVQFPDGELDTQVFVWVNNAGLVEVVSCEGGGHDVMLRIHAYDQQRDRLREALVRRLR